MITILFGPGGSGKSYYQVRLVAECLRYTQRNVSTNLSLDLPALQAWVDKQGWSVDVATRIRILTTAETKEFWKYRGPNIWNPKTDYDLVPDPGLNGTLFIIDEAGAAGFDGRGWAESTGRSSRGVEASWYLDQQRKFGDDVVASQNGTTPHGIAKPFRDKAHNFVQLKNGYLRQMGIFRARGRFTARWFASEPQRDSEPWKTENWTMDTTGLAACYRTQDGVGISGRQADKGTRAKGIPVLWAFPMAIAAASLCVLIPWLLSRGAKKITSGTSAKMHDAVRDMTHAVSGPAPVVDVSVPRVVGVVVAGDRLLVSLADRGWQPVVSRDEHFVVLADGSRVPVADVLAGRSPRPRAVSAGLP